MTRAVPLLLLILPLVPGCASQAPAAKAASLEIRAGPGAPSRVTVVLDGGGEALRRYLGPDDSVARRDEVFYLAVQPPEAAPARPIVPVLASVRWEGEEAVLSPQVSLTPGLTYTAVFDGPRLSPGFPRLTTTYTVPLDRRPSESEVTALYPTQATLPANLLKFYVHFSRPMAEGRVFQHVQLLDAAGRPVEQAFREVELWDDHRRRLTLWINPGRTKRSLGLSESLGPVLEENRSYTLVIAPGLPDQEGRPSVKGVRHPFRTADMDREQPRLATWVIEAPRPGALGPLRVRFLEPLDHALAERVIRLERGAEPVAGSVSVSDDGRLWSFTPQSPWLRGEYRLVAQGELEDLAGNSLARPFETTEGEGGQPLPEPPLFYRPVLVED